jgi:hypothetical protein
VATSSELLEETGTMGIDTLIRRRSAMSSWPMQSAGCARDYS